MSALLELTLRMRHDAEQGEAMAKAFIERWRSFGAEWQQFLLPGEPNEHCRLADTFEQGHARLVAQIDMVCDRIQAGVEWMKANPDA